MIEKTLAQSALNLGITPEGVELSSKIHRILLEECLAISSREPSPHGISPKISFDIESYVLEVPVFRINMCTNVNGMGYGEHYNIDGDGKKVSMFKPSYQKEHYGGRPNENPGVGDSFGKAAQRVHDLLIVEGFSVKEEIYMNEYTK
jgi:hypothetical protein